MCLVAAVQGPWAASAAEGPQPELVEAGPATWQFEWHNDAFASSDNQFTSGLAIRKHSDLAASLAETTGTPAFGKTLAKWLLPDAPSLHYRESWAVGQNLQTPDDLSIDTVVLNDVPYLGMLGWSNSFTAFDDSSFTGFGLMLGWVGDAALGEEAHEFGHRLSGATGPQGWDNQLGLEPVVNFYFMKKRKIWRQPDFDGAINLDVAAGNFLSFAQVALEMRAGNAPRGFVFVPVPVGRGLEYDATMMAPGGTYTYFSLVMRATGVVHSLPIEGNTFRDDNEWTENNTIDKEPLVGQAIFGLHHERERWGIHLHFWFSTDTVKDNERLFPSENPQNSFGAVTLEWRP